MRVDHETKTYRVTDFEWKASDDAPEGSFRATFATFNVMDHHGDITLPGAFENGKVVPIGAYQHAMSQLPIGSGVLGSDEKSAWVDGQFFLDTPAGNTTHAVLKRLTDEIEFSYIFTPEEASFEDEFTIGDETFHDVRVLKEIDVWSVDPVLRGAGIGTGIESIKSLGTKTFADHAGELATAVGEFIERAESRHEMRAKDGRHYSADDREQLESLATEMASFDARLADVLREAKAGEIDIQGELLRFERTRALEAGLVVPAA